MKDELYKKYLDNTLTPDELTRFREQLKASSDDDMTDLIDAYWLTRDKVVDGSASCGQEAAVKQRIDAVLAGTDALLADAAQDSEPESRPTPVIRLLRRALRYAAILLLPLLAVTTYYYYTAATSLPTGLMTVSAPSASTAEALLPDGTHVTLSHDSRLSYNLSDFNGKERRVSFSGEGWFDVAHDASSPFQVSLGGLTIHVLGTRFNVSARSCSRTSAVALLEGRVELTTAAQGHGVILSPGQEAVYDKATGHISVNRHADLAATQAWRHHEMKFDNADISTVADRLTAEYGVAITMVGNTSAHFTGVLPTDNLDACLRILKATYGLSYHISGKTVTLRMKKDK